MEGFGEDFGIFCRAHVGVQGDSSKTGDEHNLEFGIEFAGAAGQLDAVHLWHHDIGQKESKRFLLKALEGRFTVVEGYDVMTRFGQRALKEAAHGIVVFGEQNARNRETRGH